MKKLLLILSVITVCSACDSLSQLGTTGDGQTTAPTDAEVARGLKEALTMGADRGSGELSKVDGYFGNAMIKILWPPEARKIENTLNDMGLRALTEKVVLSLNRAAEDAAREAGPILKQAIGEMTFADAMDILFGGKDAATQYLRAKTYLKLEARFKPVIIQSLNRVNATRYWSEAVTTYNKIPLVKDINADLPSYVTAKALDGLFYQIEQEERKIRENPLQRATQLLKKVFRYYDERRG